MGSAPASVFELKLKLSSAVSAFPAIRLRAGPFTQHPQVSRHTIPTAVAHGSRITAPSQASAVARMIILPL